MTQRMLETTAAAQTYIEGIKTTGMALSAYQIHVTGHGRKFISNNISRFSKNLLKERRSRAILFQQSNAQAKQ